MYEIEITNLIKDGEVVCELTKTEARVLDYFIQHPNQTFSAEQLTEKLGLKSANYIRNIISALANNWSLSLPFEQVKKKGWRWIE